MKLELVVQCVRKAGAAQRGTDGPERRQTGQPNRTILGGGA